MTAGIRIAYVTSYTVTVLRRGGQNYNICSTYSHVP